MLFSFKMTVGCVISARLINGLLIFTFRAIKMRILINCLAVISGLVAVYAQQRRFFIIL
jgi:hypothetical protein